MYGVCLEPLCIVMEYVGGGSLFSALHEKKIDLSIQQKLSIAIDIASAIYYIHEYKILHRDIKTANILVCRFHFSKLISMQVSENFQEAKLIDFGTSKRNLNVKVDATQTVDLKSVVSPQYTAPEVLTDESCTDKSDIYSFGIVL